MLKIGITGAYGLIGWHSRCRLFVEDGIEAIPAGRGTFRDTGALDTFVRQCDAIVHLAGMNRGEDAEIAQVNVGLAEALAGAMERVGTRPQSSSPRRRTSTVTRRTAVPNGRLPIFSGGGRNVTEPCSLL